MADGTGDGPHAGGSGYRRVARYVCAAAAAVTPVSYLSTNASHARGLTMAMLTFVLAGAAVALGRPAVRIGVVLEVVTLVGICVLLQDVLLSLPDPDVDPATLPFTWLSTGSLSIVIVEFAVRVEWRRLVIGVVLGTWLGSWSLTLGRPVDPQQVVASVVFLVFTAVLVDAIGRRRHLLHEDRDRVALQAELARIDDLTGLLNRRGAVAVLAEVVQAGTGGVVLCDIDHFKAVNDEHGHDVGDHVLVAAADALRATVRDRDVVARWGGEEFLVVAPDALDDAMLVRIAERMRRAVATAAGPVPVTISAGVATVISGQDADDLLRRADSALYRAKDDGRDRVVSADAG